MFSVLVPGRLPLVGPQQVDATHAVFQLAEAGSVDHLSVFMTGEQAFPPGYAATVHYLPPGASPQGWLLLGGLANNKPSSFYRLRNLPLASSATSSSAGFGPDSSAQGTGLIGISVELEQAVAGQVGAQGYSPAEVLEAEGVGAGALVKVEDKTSLALRIAPKVAQNAFEYLNSFAPDSAPQTAPLLNKWLEQFMRKLKLQGMALLEKESV